jgi:hypothetical protein
MRFHCDLALLLCRCARHSEDARLGTSPPISDQTKKHKWSGPCMKQSITQKGKRSEQRQNELHHRIG